MLGNRRTLDTKSVEEKQGLPVAMWRLKKAQTKIDHLHERVLQTQNFHIADRIGAQHP